MEWVKSQWDSFTKDLKSMNKRQLIGQGVNLGWHPALSGLLSKVGATSNAT